MIHAKRLPIDKRCLMPGIAVAQMSGAEVEHPGEEGDEDSQATVADDHIVHAANDTHRLRLTLCQQTEGAADRGHHQSSGHTLAGNVADAEVEAVVAQEEVVEVATHGLGGGQRGINLQIRALRDVCPQNRHLYPAGH